MATATMPKPTTVEASITIPKGCKPSKACSTDWTRPLLCHAYLTHEPDGGPWLCMTDSFIAVALRVETDAEDGFIPIGALRLMETGKPGTRVSDTSWSVKTNEGTVTFDCGPMGKFPNLKNLGLWDKPEERADVAAVGMDPALMSKISAALGARNGLRMDFIGELRPVYVTPLRFDRGLAMQMPIRLNV